MFRPNRIGSHPLSDLSSSDHEIATTDGQFTSTVGTINAHQVQTDSAFYGDPAFMVNVRSANTPVTFSLAAGKSWCFGRAVSGIAPNDRETLFNVSGELRVFGATNTDISLGFHLGRANASAPSVDATTAVNLIDNRLRVPVIEIPRTANICGFSTKCTVVDTIFNGGAAGVYDSFPIFAYYSITNYNASSAFVIKGIDSSLSIYKYTEDIDSFDPNR